MENEKWEGPVPQAVPPMLGRLQGRMPVDLELLATFTREVADALARISTRARDLAPSTTRKALLAKAIQGRLLQLKLHKSMYALQPGIHQHSENVALTANSIGYNLLLQGNYGYAKLWFEKAVRDAPPGGRAQWFAQSNLLLLEHDETERSGASTPTSTPTATPAEEPGSGRSIWNSAADVCLLESTDSVLLRVSAVLRLLADAQERAVEEALFMDAMWPPPLPRQNATLRRLRCRLLAPGTAEPAAPRRAAGSAAPV